MRRDGGTSFCVGEGVGVVRVVCVILTGILPRGEPLGGPFMVRGVRFRVFIAFLASGTPALSGVLSKVGLVIRISGGPNFSGGSGRFSACCIFCVFCVFCVLCVLCGTVRIFLYFSCHGGHTLFDVRAGACRFTGTDIWSSCPVLGRNRRRNPSSSLSQPL